MNPPAPFSRHLSLLLAWGDENEARLLLKQLNRVQSAFGGEPYSMPEAASVGLPDLVKCDATKVSDVLGEQVERELRRTIELQGDAARAARALAASQSRRVSPSRPSGLRSLSQRKSA